MLNGIYRGTYAYRCLLRTTSSMIELARDSKSPKSREGTEWDGLRGGGRTLRRIRMLSGHGRWAMPDSCRGAQAIEGTAVLVHPRNQYPEELHCPHGCGPRLSKLTRDAGKGLWATAEVAVCHGPWAKGWPPATRLQTGIGRPMSRWWSQAVTMRQTPSSQRLSQAMSHPSRKPGGRRKPFEGQLSEKVQGLESVTGVDFPGRRDCRR
jgi:hypothetical protein